MAEESINPQPDLTDPETLCRLLLAAVGGLRQEALARRQTSCMAGHPQPEQFFNSVADRIEAAVAMIKPPSVETPPQTAKTVPQPAKVKISPTPVAAG